MKFLLSFYGSRGDVEPGVAVGRELVRRGHDVKMAVSPNLVDFAESHGFAAVSFGPDAGKWQDLHRDFMMLIFRSFWRIPDLIRLGRENWRMYGQFWEEANATLLSLADEADLVVADAGFDQPVANVAEYYNIPLATLHTSPLRAHEELVSTQSSPLIRAATSFSKWLGERLEKTFWDRQRSELGLPKTTSPSVRRVSEHGSLEIQAYDAALFPALEAKLAASDAERPMVGALTVEAPAEADEEVLSWIAAGTPPIFFGFGSMPVESPVDTLAMIADACTQLGERALICSAATDFGDEHRDFDRVKVVGSLNFAAVFPACRAVVHHGGTGTTAAGLRAGVPTLILSTWLDQTLWGAQVKQLNVGTTRRLSTTTQESLVADLRTILAPDYVARAREFAGRMTKPAESAANAADLVEKFAQVHRVG
ncbi:glycosyl transferase family 1 [Mycolicibacterium agri]|uniref:Glycosyl transferase family 1 n=1 Tax=Mycolicibacterium agri TaxID=36811 RepID=A0A2A7MV91_MYCAG|nr:glycosyltransferase [Mycolicibacterium agri]PEG35645.1 glycosyl transferase family 1 [Mycolicibacterium agri]GFG50523.1 glycosyltransferase GtfA [Mycolicibacterium agri]